MAKLMKSVWFWLAVFTASVLTLANKTQAFGTKLIPSDCYADMKKILCHSKYKGQLQKCLNWSKTLSHHVNVNKVKSETLNAQ